jgi:hypothetical protein
VDLQLRGDLAIRCCRNFLNSIALAGMEGADHLAGGGVASGAEARGPERRKW